MKWFCYQALRYVLWLYHLPLDTAAFLLENMNLIEKTEKNSYMSTQGNTIPSFNSPVYTFLDRKKNTNQQTEPFQLWHSNII